MEGVGVIFHEPALGEVAVLDAVHCHHPNLDFLENELVAENYQLIMHRLAEQAAGDDVSDTVRAQKLAEARFITEMLTGERTWEQ